MGLLNFLKKKKKNKYEILHEVVTNVLNALESKKNLADIGVTIDLDFDANMKGKMLVFSYIKNGIISFWGKELEEALIEIFNTEKIDIELTINTHKYLKNEQLKLQKLF